MHRRGSVDTKDAGPRTQRIKGVHSRRSRPAFFKEEAPNSKDGMIDELMNFGILSLGVQEWKVPVEIRKEQGGPT